MRKLTFLFIIFVSFQTSISASKFDSYKGLVMAGYQGWFNTPGDGANRHWFHYQKNRIFEPGSCSIDMWPEMSEYEKKYETSFKFKDGSPAYVFSSYDESTIDLHFKWMKDYGIDGVFLQRFIVTLKTESGRIHSHKVLKSALKAAEKYGRTIAVMYDLSGMNNDDYSILMQDWEYIKQEFKVHDRSKYGNYLFHNGRPLVAVWGVGFNDNRKYGFDTASKIVEFLKSDNNSVHLGVPTHWRSLTGDTLEDTQLHTIIKKVDIVHPWFVGRYNLKTYDAHKQIIIDDIKWCKQNGVDYVPTVFPGFSWYNLKEGAKSNHIPRHKGQFLWKQFAGAIDSGSEMIYVAMFDEIDEATAIFKISPKVPVGKSVFVPIEKGLKPDHYLWLTGMGKKMLEKSIPFSWKQPKRKTK